VTQSRQFAVVTGASSGIGRELAREFTANGFDVLVAAEDPGLAPLADEQRLIGLNVGSTVHLANGSCRAWCAAAPAGSCSRPR
jgi:NAD(P)-dependent dehydrogenase (short-subunit alcohol dehydrogenase family)